MRRSIVIIAVLLCVIVTGWIYENNLLDTVYAECSARLSDIYNNQTEKNAPIDCKYYLEAWEKHRRTFALLITHTDTDEILRHNMLLKIYAESGDNDRVREEIGELCHIYNNLKNKFKVNLENIF